MAVDAGTIQFDTDVDLSDLRQDLEAVQEDIEDALSSINDMGDDFDDAASDANSVEEETEQIADNLQSMPELNIDANTRELRSVQEEINDLDGQDVDVDVDRAGRIGRGLGEAVGKVGVVEEDLGRDIGGAAARLSVALGGSATAAAAAGAGLAGAAAAAATVIGGFVGAGGLAVKALQLSNKFDEAASPAVAAGLSDLKTATKNLKKRFVRQMSPLLANEVIPELKLLAENVAKSIPALVEFAETWVPSMVQGTARFASFIPNVLAALEAIMAALSGLWDATRAYTNVMRSGVIKALDGLLRVFQEMAKAGVEFTDMIPGVDIEDSVLQGIEDWDNPLENLDDRLEENISRTWDEAVENFKLSFESSMQAFGFEDTEGEGTTSTAGLFSSREETGPDAEKVEPAPLEVVPAPSLKKLLEEAGLAQEGGGSKDEGRQSFQRGIAQGLTDLPGITANVDKLTQKLKDSNQASQLAAQGLRTLSTIGSQAITQLASTFGRGIGKVIAGTKGFEDLGKALLKEISNLMQTIASALISIGSAMAIVPGFQGPAAAYIAGGTALMAAASALGATISGDGQSADADSGGGSSDTLGIASLDSGGVVTSDGLAMLHSNEVVRDADVDRDMMQSGFGSGGGTLEAVVEGEQLRFVLEETARRDAKTI